MEKERFHKLLSKKLSNNISNIEVDELEQAISSEAIYEQVDRKFTAYFASPGKETANPEMLDQIWNRINNEDQIADRFNDTHFRKKQYFRFLNAAAALVLIVGIVVIAYQLTKKEAIVFAKVSTTNHKAFQILDDGTKVWLNQESEILYNEDFGKDKREIFLKGEAYFDVTKNQKVPLVVHAGEIDVKVKGTSFNVDAKNENKEIQVILVSGLIEVAKQQGKKFVVVYPNQKLIYTRQAEAQFQIITMSAISMLKEVKWKNDTLHFNNERLDDLALKLEKKYNVKINISSAQLKEKRFSGTFTNETLQQVLEALKLSYPLTYTINNKLVLIKD